MITVHANISGELFLLCDEHGTLPISAEDTKFVTIPEILTARTEHMREHYTPRRALEEATA